MKILLPLLIFTSLPIGFAEAAPLKLQCMVFDRRCDKNGGFSHDKYEMSAELEFGESVVKLEGKSKDGRFDFRGYGRIETEGESRPKTVIAIYDSQTRSGAAAGTLALRAPAAPRSELVYVYDTKSIDDGTDLFCHSLEASCDLK